MSYYDRLINQQLEPEKLLEYGFKLLEPNHYQMIKALATENFEAEITINSKAILVRVIELPDHLEYLPFQMKQHQGSFVNQIRAEVDEVVTEVIEHCYQARDYRQIVFDFVEKELNTKVEQPWEDHPEYYVMKSAKKGKWFAVMMRLPYHLLEKDKKGQVEVLNVKVPPTKVLELMDHQHYYPAYHMNKKHWISIVMNEETDFGKVKKLIEQSYQLVES